MACSLFEMTGREHDQMQLIQNHKSRKSTGIIASTHILIAVLSLGSGCIRRSSSSTSSQPSSSPVTQEAPEIDKRPNEFGINLPTPVNERTALGQKFADASLIDLFISLSHCGCLPRLQANLVSSMNGLRGTLPQALVPAIRREILSNSMLKILNILPGSFSDIVGGLFVDEQKVSDAISDGLHDKLKIAEPGWSAQPERPTLQLDGFIPLPATTPGTLNRFVRMMDIWSRWSLILSQGGPWSSERAMHPQKGLLWHELLRALAEAEYLFGLARTDDGKILGGLTLPVDLQITSPGPFDPRLAYNQIRFLTGQLEVTLPTNNSLTLARFGGEKWMWSTGRVNLSEQAIQWWVSAQLLHRLRPSNRGTFSSFFPSLIPEDAYQLSLLVLPALDALLSNRFIDEKSRLIRSYIDGPQVDGMAHTVREKADPQTLSFLLLALSSWLIELKSINDLSLSTETASQLTNAPASLLKGTQLIVQTLLNETLKARMKSHSDTNQGPPETEPWSVFSLHAAQGKNQTDIELPLREHTQILYSLIIAEKNFMNSAYLRMRIHQLAAGMIQRWNDFQSFDSSKDPLAPRLWIKSAVDKYLSSYSDSPLLPALREISAKIDAQVQSFEDTMLK